VGQAFGITDRRATVVFGIIDARRRFIQKQNVRPVNDTGGNGEFALHALGISAEFPVFQNRGHIFSTSAFHPGAELDNLIDSMTEKSYGKGRK
jgi:hypothetical protein